MITRKEIIDNLRKALLKASNEAVLISSQTNQRYLSGFDYTDGYILLTAERAYLIADFRYIEAAVSRIYPSV